MISYSNIFYSFVLIPPSSLSQQYTLYEKPILHFHEPHEHVNSQLDRIFSGKFPSERLTINKTVLASGERHGIALAIDGARWEGHDYQ